MLIGIKPAASTSLQHIAPYNSVMGGENIFIVSIAWNNYSGIKNCFDAFSERASMFGGGGGGGLKRCFGVRKIMV